MTVHSHTVFLELDTFSSLSSLDGHLPLLVAGYRQETLLLKHIKRATSQLTVRIAPISK
jgi:hypothetical protein